MIRLFLIAWIASLALSEARPRVAVITDGSRDQRCSMIRFLLYSNAWEVTGFFVEGERTWLNDQLTSYAQCEEKLRDNDGSFPLSDQLKTVIRESTAANIATLLKEPHQERLHILAWANVDRVAEALSLLKDETSETKAMVAKQTRVHLLGEPSGDSLKVFHQWPDVEVLISASHPSALGPDWKTQLPENTSVFFKAEWMNKHILTGHGPLCSSYEAHAEEPEGGWTSGDFYAEPASVTFLRLLPNGLGSALDPSYGGWGGRFEKRPGHVNIWQEGADDGDPLKPIWRWLTHIQGDWSVRADWCVRDRTAANHAPVAALNGKAGVSVLSAKAKAGQTLTLDASASQDPDGQRIAKAWWYYAEPSTYKGPVVMDSGITDKITFTVPFDKEPQTHHVMLTVRDGGTPGLFAYRRLIVQATAGEDTTPPKDAPSLSGKSVDSSSVSLSWTPSSDQESGIRHYKVYRDGKHLEDVLAPQFLDTNLPEATAASYHVVAVNGALLESPSSTTVSLATLADVLPPEPLSISVHPTAITLIFSEPLESTSASSPMNYLLDQGARVTSATLSEDGTSVTLETTPLPLGSSPCFLSIQGLKDRAKHPNVVEAGTIYGFLYETSE